MLSQSLRVLSVRDQASICPFALREVSVLAELALGHLRYSLTDVPPQSNSPPGGVLGIRIAPGPGPAEAPRPLSYGRQGRTTAGGRVRGLTPGALGWCLTLPEYQPRPGTTGAPATGPAAPRRADRTPDEPTTSRRHERVDAAGAGRTRGRYRAFRSTE